MDEWKIEWVHEEVAIWVSEWVGQELTVSPRKWMFQLSGPRRSQSASWSESALPEQASKVLGRGEESQRPRSNILGRTE